QLYEACAVRLLGVHRGVYGGVREVHGQRLVGFGGPGLGDHAHGPVGQIIGQVVALRVLLDVDGTVAFVELVRIEQAGLGFEEAVELVEAALQRPRVPVTGR